MLCAPTSSAGGPMKAQRPIHRDQVAPREKNRMLSRMVAIMCSPDRCGAVLASNSKGDSGGIEIASESIGGAVMDGWPRRSHRQRRSVGG